MNRCGAFSRLEARFRYEPGADLPRGQNRQRGRNGARRRAG